MKETLTLVVPVWNEATQIPRFLERTSWALKSERVRWECLFVDDGSTDGTECLIREMQQVGWQVEVVILSRNFGKEAALTAGLDRADGDAVVPIDVDLQDPPEVIPDLLEKWRDGADVVLARRESRSEETGFKRISAHLYYRLMSFASEHKIPPNVGDFRLLDSRVVKVVRDLRERTRYMKGLLMWPGFQCEVVMYSRPKRDSGAERQSIGKLIRLALDGIISFTSLPLRVWSLAGIVTAAVAGLYMVWIVMATLLFGRDVPGYASLMSAILFIGGVQLLSIGVLGEYVARVFSEVKQRPIYVVKEHWKPESSAREEAGARPRT